MLQTILEKDPLKRATLEQIAQSEWISNCGKEKIDFLVEARTNNQCLRDDEVYHFGNMRRIIPRIQTQRGDIEDIDYEW